LTKLNVNIKNLELLEHIMFVIIGEGRMFVRPYGREPTCYLLSAVLYIPGTVSNMFLT